MPEIVLWQMPPSPPSWSVRMLGDILGLDFQLKDVDFLGKEHKSPEFKQLNPMGTLPVIQDGEFVVSESHAISKYLLRKYGESQEEKLYPSDIETRARVDQAMFFDTGVAFIRLKLIALPAVFGKATGLSADLIVEIEDVYGVLDLYLGKSSYVAADHMTLADLSLGSTANSLQPFHPIDAEKYPRSADWLARINEEDFFKNIALPGAELLFQTVQFFWEKNKAE